MEAPERAWWRWYLAVAFVVGGAYFVLPESGLTKLVTYNALGLSAVCALLVGVRLNQPRRRLPWRLFAAGQAMFLIADLIFYAYQDILHVPSPFPSVADFFYLAMYPLVSVGLALLIRDLLPGRDRASMLDAAIISTSLFVLTWVFLMDSYATDPTLTLLERVISLAYPAMDFLLIAVAARLVASVWLRAPAFVLIAASVASLFIADMAYGITQLSGTYETGSVIDVFWMLFYVLFGAAALHPSMRQLSTRAQPAGGGLTFKRLVLLSCTTMAVPVVDLFVRNEELADEVVLTGATVVLFVLVLGRIMDLVRAVERGREQLRHDALHDGLTDLPNRALFAARVHEALDDEQPDQHVAVLFIDLDDFKTVNDSFGHEVGDELIVQVAERLRRCLRPGDTAARLGGDEFALLLAPVHSRAEAGQLATRVLDSLEPPVGLGSREVRVAASIGIAVETATAATVEGLLRGADVAMYLAKSKGKGRFEFFEQHMYDHVIEQLELKADLQEALERGELELHYQPILKLGGAIIGMEALLRWNHPTRGPVQPVKFIPIAEETGLIVPIGRWVIQEACRQARLWQLRRAEDRELHVSVNLSVRQLHDPGLVEDVAEALRASGLPPECLTLEVTESILMNDADNSAERLGRLKQLNVRLAVDDFGTGYSSLSQLQRFPVDEIKIDQSFVQELTSGGTNTSALIRSVIDLADALEITTVAEGIEDLDQLTRLRALDCKAGQGFLFSRPLTVSGFTDLLDDNSSLTEGALRSLPGGPASLFAPVATPGMIEVHHGRHAIRRLQPELDDLQHALRLPLMGRRIWHASWLRSFAGYEPWTFIVRSEDGSRIDASALLACRPSQGPLRFVAVGHGSGGSVHLNARTDRAADVLAEGIAATLNGLAQPWQLDLEQLPAGDAVPTRLHALLPGSTISPEMRVPRVRFPSGMPVEQVLSRNTRRALRKATTKAAADGLEATIEFERDPGVIAHLLDEIEIVHRRRDHDLRRQSDLDESDYRRFWREVILGHARRHQIELATYRLDGRLAAYVISLLDDRVYRVLDGRFDTNYARYSPGRVVETATLARALDDEHYVELDWMSGFSSEKLLVENAEQRRVRLVAGTDLSVAGAGVGPVGRSFELTGA